MNEKLVELMNEARMINVVDNVIFPMIEKKIKDKVDQAAALFRGGEKDFLSHVSYVAALQDILNELKQKQTNGNRAIESLHREN